MVLTEHAPAALRPQAGRVEGRTTTRDWSASAAGEHGYRVLATTADGDPLVIEGPLGKGRIVLALAAGLPWSWGSELLLAAHAASRSSRASGSCPAIPAGAPWPWRPSMPAAVALPAWTTADELAALHGRSGQAPSAGQRGR